MIIMMMMMMMMIIIFLCSDVCGKNNIMMMNIKQREIQARRARALRASLV